ncbi:uncharacterized protein I303_105715 [Kwoniella dejecticola CBS 10117]|uniref:CLASP N-terminal domain-containing protein n=1 Tax=Kwoniella dejecticola CBS 10117 TaxID=1296121 RepID=A0A1A6A068_9TREE|nr:uncharacterized protein I303_05736 [Kwoniella dejecticola CBS 10117]OBR83457.1 hypothetical protein I303_05736 [Kwoniella dejecticola CBS 10117]
MPPALAADAKIPCPTPQHLKEELDALTWALEPEEKEDTWEKFERAIIRFSAVTRGGGYKHTEQYVNGVGRGGIGKKLVKCMLSDRGRLSGVTTDLLQTFAPRLSHHFKPLVNLYVEPVLTLLGRPNKVFLKRAEKCLLTIITHCQLIGILPELRRGLNDNAITCRRGSSIGIERAMKEWPAEIWTEKYLVLLEESVRKMAVDKDPEVRQTSRRVWSMFMEFWPERVEDFSAPLTPTVRRYLDLPAAGANGAGPSKPKAKASARPAHPPAPAAAPLPTNRPVSAASSESSHHSAPVHPIASARPQHHRVHALASRPLRPILDAPPPAVDAGSSRRHASRVDPEPLPPASESSLPENAPNQPTLSRSASVSVRLQNDFAPPSFGLHGRSASHSVLPTASMAEPVRQNPLSKPSRPALHISHTAPTETLETVGPPRRFAPPARIVRVMPSEEEAGVEYGDHPFMTPSGATVLRGPQRNPHAGLGRKANALGGQAHRRVVTAPSMVEEEGYFVKTPGRSLGLGGSGAKRDDIEEDEAKQKLEVPKAFASPLPSQVIAVESPLMPTLMRSSSGEVRAEENESDLIDMKAHMSVYPASPLKTSIEAEEEREVVEVARKIELPDSPVRQAMDLPTAEQDEEIVANEPEEEHAENYKEDDRKELVLTAAAEEQEIEQQQNPAIPADETGNEAKQVVEADLLKSDPITAPEVIDAKPTEVERIKTSSSKTADAAPSASVRQVKDQAQAASRPAEAPAARPAATKPKIEGRVARKPPVPSARSVTARAVSAPVVRKAFKPTSLTAPTAASAARAGPATTRPPQATTAVSKPTIATSTTAKAPSASHPSSSVPASSKPSTAPVNRARVVSAQIVKTEPKASTKPPIPPNEARPKATTRIVSGPKISKPPTAHVTLPAVKKDKVVRKAPLPSFRPTRGAASGTASLKASTSSVLSSGAAAPGPANTNGRAKVKPEHIKLPESPFKHPSASAGASEVPLPPSPHELPLPLSPRPRAPSAMGTTSATGSPLKLTGGSRARVHKDSILNLHVPQQSPIKTMSPAKPLSPLLTTTTAQSEEILPSQPVFTSPPSPRPPHTEPFTAKISESKADTEDPFLKTGMNIKATPNSKSSDGGMSTSTELLNTSTSSTDAEVDGGMDVSISRITFKSLSPSRSSSIQLDQRSHISKVAHGNRSDVSTPSSKASALLAKLEGSDKAFNIVGYGYTPERKALSVKDANTPGRLAEEWDVSA